MWDGAESVVKITDAIAIAFAHMLSLYDETYLTFVKFTIFAFDLMVETCTEYVVLRSERGPCYGFENTAFP